jgi:hypothetical protein
VKKILTMMLLLVAGRVCAEAEAVQNTPDSIAIEKSQNGETDKMSPIEAIHEVAGVAHDVADAAQEVIGEVHDLAEFVEAATEPGTGGQQPAVPELDILQQLVSEITGKLSAQGLGDAQIYDFFSKINGLKLTSSQVISFLKDFSEATSQNVDTSSTSVFGKISSKLSSPKYAAAVGVVGGLLVGILVGRYVLSKTATPTK